MEHRYTRKYCQPVVYPDPPGRLQNYEYIKEQLSANGFVKTIPDIFFSSDRAYTVIKKSGHGI